MEQQTAIGIILKKTKKSGDGWYDFSDAIKELLDGKQKPIGKYNTQNEAILLSFYETFKWYNIQWLNWRMIAPQLFPDIDIWSVWFKMLVATVQTLAKALWDLWKERPVTIVTKEKNYWWFYFFSIIS